MNYAQLLFPDFSLILCGYFLCRFTGLNRSVWQQTEHLVYYFLFPVLLFYSIAKSPLDIQATSSFLMAGVSMGLAGIALSYSLPYWPWLGSKINRRDHAASAQIGFRFNSFIALALVERLCGAEGLLLISVLIGFCVPMFNVGAVWPMARHGDSGFGREIVRNPLILATTSGLAFNLSGFAIPAILDPSLSKIGAASLALGLLSAGAGMEVKALNQGKLLGSLVLTLKHLFLPCIAWSLAQIFKLNELQTTVLLIFSALPTASTCYVLAARMGYNGSLVAGLVTLSTLLGMLSLPFALGVLQGLRF
ncbi:AEC family transporter [Limnohabitans sp. MMS-10A-178]|uniref:AEC family transporter n=1 Tax=Limnohabitans sp. MMS-10A-178 TaxID=1835767 RepID=UPI000D34F564|nr:AEC family transporter [Limnohabitans sp. MMS-10A-178]PUE17150.1 transporter [Limnohabitans sp. MMS-10A-178]